MSPDLPIRPRRLRLRPQMRDMLQQVKLHRSDLILPLFVCEGTNQKREVASMPGVWQMSVDVAREWLARRADEGFKSYLVFGVIDRKAKDAAGSAALDENNVVCRMLRAAAKIPMVGITDLCFCEYTDHGHCGPLSEDQSTVRNDETVERLVKQAMNHAKAGAAVIAPSGMMDGAGGGLRKGLDGGGFGDVGVLGDAGKYGSGVYGPFWGGGDLAA